MESNLFKYYIVIAIQNNNFSRVHEFFKTCVDRVSSDPDWSTWFCLYLFF